jgi:hypothetical protein
LVVGCSVPEVEYYDAAATADGSDTDGPGQIICASGQPQPDGGKCCPTPNGGPCFGHCSLMACATCACSSSQVCCALGNNGICMTPPCH